MPTPKTANSELRIKNFPLKNSIFKRSSKIAGKEGFTLIELLIVVAIIGILSTIVLANYNSFGTRQQVKNAAGQLKSELRKYQNLAISGQKDPDQSGDCTATPPPDNTLRFYAVVVDPSSPTPYSVFLDCTLVPKILTDDPPWSENIVLAGVGHYDGTSYSPQTSVDIEFRPLNADVNLESPDGTSVPVGSSVYIRLTNNDNSTTYNVFVTSSGEIYDERQP